MDDNFSTDQPVGGGRASGGKASDGSDGNASDGELQVKLCSLTSCCAAQFLGVGAGDSCYIGSNSFCHSGMRLPLTRKIQLFTEKYFSADGNICLLTILIIITKF